MKRKYDLCLTAANVDHSPDGMPVAAWLQSGWGVVYCFINLFFGILEVRQALFVQTAGLFTFAKVLIPRWIICLPLSPSWLQLCRLDGTTATRKESIFGIKSASMERVYEESTRDLPLIASSFTATLSRNFRLCSL